MNCELLSRYVANWFFKADGQGWKWLEKDLQLISCSKANKINHETEMQKLQS